jgi:uncharacterized protein YraI
VYWSVGLSICDLRLRVMICSQVDMNVQAGSEVQVTTGPINSPGSVLLVAQSTQALDEDCAAIRRLEKEGLFVLV